MYVKILVFINKSYNSKIVFICNHQNQTVKIHFILFPKHFSSCVALPEKNVKQQ